MNCSHLESPRSQVTLLLSRRHGFIDLFLKILLIYLRDRDSRSRGGAGGEGEGKEDSSLLSREPKTGLDPRTLGSQPELKADA